MKRRGVWLLIVAWVALTGVARGAGNHKMSRYVRQAAVHYQESGVRRIGVRGLETRDGRFMTAFVCISPGEADAVFAKHHCRKYAQWGDICIAGIPLVELEALAAEPTVTRIEANQSNHLCVDTTAAIVKALPVYESSSSHQAYTGEGVVLGVVDVGLDLTHPNFVDHSTGQLRIGAFWDQLSRDTIDSSLPVGRDYVGAEAISAIGQSTDAPTLTHGTHTLGIAAGSGFDTSYRGIAWGSDLCVVGNAINTNIEYVDSADYYKYTTATDALGFKYCFDYAEAQGKPCVVSFSEGYSPYLDEEDSLFAATIEALTGPGRIIVTSAGNESVEMTYFEKATGQKEAGSFVRNFKKAAVYRIKSEGEMRLVVYGYGKEESGKWKEERGKWKEERGKWKVESGKWKEESGKWKEESGKWKVESGKWKEESGVPSDTIAFETAEVPIDTVIKRKILYGEDSLTVAAYRDRSRFGDHDIWQLLLEADTTLNLLPPLAVVVQAQGKVEVYGSSTNAFRDHAADDRWRAAITGRNVLAPGCFPGVICVGATTHRLSIRNIAGEDVNGSKETESGKIGYYSSTGPAMNDLLKPDVVAPGTNVVSSYSHVFCPEKAVVTYSDYAGERYPWGVESGTSMATPVVAGAIALWLHAKPDLTPQEVREVLRRSCRHPEAKYEYPNNIYGYGEIDVYKGLLEVLSLSGVEGISCHQLKGVKVIPVEGSLKLVFDGVTTEPVRVRVYNLSGVCILDSQLKAVATETSVALPSILSGVYAVQVESAARSLQGSVLVRF